MCWSDRLRFVCVLFTRDDCLKYVYISFREIKTIEICSKYSSGIASISVNVICAKNIEYHKIPWIRVE